MSPYQYTSGKNPPPRAPNFAIQLKRWIAENRDLVKRLVALSGGDSAERASKDYLKKWAGTWQRGLWYWSLGERPGQEWWTDEYQQLREEAKLDEAELQE